MKKIVLLFACFILTSEVLAGEPFMDKALSSWVGYPVDSVIKYWGYPDSQQKIAGKDIYIWEEKSEYQDGGYQTSKVRTDKKGRTYVDTYSYGSTSYEMMCRRILEVNSDYMITGYSYKGNTCPSAYFLKAKSFVNPENNEWERRKLEKQMQKAKR